jgi:NADH:ubiquinone oxidoreductase subunit E
MSEDGFVCFLRRMDLHRLGRDKICYCHPTPCKAQGSPCQKILSQLKYQFSNKTKQNKTKSWVWWHTPLIPALRRQRQTDF